MNKKITKTLSVVFLMAGLFSCSEDTSLLVQESSDSSSRNQISISEALDLAGEEYARIFGQTRSNSDLKLKSFEIYKPNHATRSEESEMHGFYILNFEDNAGFAIVSADTRRENIYAISEEGNIQLADTLTNEGLKWYLNESLTISGNFNPITPVDTASIANPFLPEIETYCKPLLSGFMSKFGQGYPFNKYCFTSDGRQAVVGCVPLAIGTVMGLDQLPQSFKGITFDWTAMKSDQNHDGWARLFEVIGRRENVNASYGVNSTGALSSLIPNALKNMGYKDADIAEFSSTIVNQQLSDNRTVLMGGVRDSGAHRWVIDGGYAKVTKSYATETTFDYHYSYYYHCVWGWNGNANGYFYLSNTIGGIPDSRDLNTSGNANVYYPTTIVYGYKPNK